MTPPELQINVLKIRLNQTSVVHAALGRLLRVTMLVIICFSSAIKRYMAFLFESRESAEMINRKNSTVGRHKDFVTIPVCVI